MFRNWDISVFHPNSINQFLQICIFVILGYPAQHWLVMWSSIARQWTDLRWDNLSTPTQNHKWVPSCNHSRTSTFQTVKNCHMEINTYSGHHSIDFLQRKEKQSLVISYQTNWYFLTERKIPLFFRNGGQKTCFEAASSISCQHVTKPTVLSQPACAIGMGVWHLCEEAKLIHGISLTFSITLKKIPVN